MNQIKVLAYKDKNDWILETKYNIGSKKKKLKKFSTLSNGIKERLFYTLGKHPENASLHMISMALSYAVQRSDDDLLVRYEKNF